MEEITRTIEDHKEALNRVMKTDFDQEKSTIRFGRGQWLKKPVILVLWIMTGISALLLLATILMPHNVGTTEAVTFLSVLIIIFLLLIRVLSYEININLAEGTFTFRGQLRKNRTFSLADYEGAETRYTVKDFPEEFCVKFKTTKGTRSYKLADLNMGYARNIEPNHEAVEAIWDAIIKQMQSKDNYQLESNNNQEVAPDTR